jgi:hypothetical protein
MIMPDESEKTAPMHHRVDGAKDYEAAIDNVVTHAKHSLRIFDYDLSEGGYNRPRRFELLRDFLLASRANSLHVVIHETAYLTRYCPRMVLLLEQFGHAIKINQTAQHAKGIYDPFVIADAEHYVHRFHYEGSRSMLALHDPAGSRTLNQRFDELWEASTAAVFATTLGL